MRTITACLEKGGSAKTTTNTALGSGLAQRGYRVLFVDLDPQANLSQTLNADLSKPSAFEVMVGEVSALGAIQKKDGDVSVIPCSRKASRIDSILGGEQRREYRIKEALDTVRGSFDFCIIDTPPALGILTVNALTAANSLIIPCQTDIYALEAIGNLYRTVNSVKKYSNRDLKIEGILLTRYNPRTTLGKLATEKATEIAESIGTKVFETKIREGVAIREAQMVHEDIFTYAHRSNVAKDYGNFIDELLEGIGND